MSNLPQKIFNGDSGMPGINTGQEALFLLVCKALEEKRIIQYKECEHIYKTTVMVSEFGWSDFWDSDEQEWKDKQYKRTDWEIKQLADSWLLRALGALIKKGYLTVIPRIELSKSLPVKE